MATLSTPSAFCNGKPGQGWITMVISVCLCSPACLCLVSETMIYFCVWDIYIDMNMNKNVWYFMEFYGWLNTPWKTNSLNKENYCNQWPIFRIKIEIFFWFEYGITMLPRFLPTIFSWPNKHSQMSRKHTNISLQVTHYKACDHTRPWLCKSPTFFLHIATYHAKKTRTGFHQHLTCTTGRRWRH